MSKGHGHGHGHRHEHGHEHGHGHGGHHHHGPYDRNRNPVDRARYLERLEGSDRAAWQMPDRLVEELGLQPGDHACDVGVGPGYLALRMARAVGPEGVVHAIDVEPAMIEVLRERSARAGLSNVRGILGRPGREALPPRRCRVILIVNTYHHFPDGVRSLRRLAGRLSAGGRIVVVDFHRRELPVGPPRDHKVSRASVVEAARAAGLVLARERRFLPYQYFLEFVPVSSPGAAPSVRKARRPRRARRGA